MYNKHYNMKWGKKLMKVIRLFIFGFILLFLPFILTAQSNSVIDELLEKEKADWEQTAYMVLTAAELMDEDAEISKVFTYLEKEQLNPDSKNPEDFITLGEYSNMLMKAFNIPGGLMYKLFKGPRYAARELDYLKFIDNDKSPYRYISGEEVLRIMGRVLEWKGENL